MRKIPLAAVPGQRISVTLENRRYSLSIKEARGVIVCDISVDDEELVAGSRVLAGEMLIPYRYLGDGGNFILQTIGDELPDWRNFGASQDLYFLTAEDLEAAQKSPPSPGRISFNAPALLFGFNTPAGMIMGQEPKGMAIDFLKNSSIIRDGTNRNDGGNFSGGAFDIGTFNRASGGTYFDQSGVLRMAAVNEWRSDHDPVTHEPRGLLIEEQRTNLYISSGDFRTVGEGNLINGWNDAGTNQPVASVSPNRAPDGIGYYTRLTRTTLNGGDRRCAATFPAGSTLTASVYFKRGTLPIAEFQVRLLGGVTVARSVSYNWETGGLDSDATRGWVEKISEDEIRLSLTLIDDGDGNGAYLLLSAGGAAAPGYQDVWGAQLEVGAFPTSYIPTTTAQATRAADKCVVPASDWYNQSEGTLFVEYDTFGLGWPGHVVAGFSSETAPSFANTIYILSTELSRSEIFVRTDGSDVANMALPGNKSGAIKAAGALEADHFAFAVDGELAGTDNNGVMPAGMGRLIVGSAPWRPGDAVLNGHIKRFAYFPRRLSNAEIQEITA